MASTDKTSTDTAASPRTVRILVVGVSFAGLAVTKALCKELETLAASKSLDDILPDRVEIILLDSKKGLINTYAAARALVDPDFAAKTYASLDQLNLPSYDSSYSLLHSETWKSKFKLEIELLDGWCYALFETHATIRNWEGDEFDLKFDYCVFATGVKRRYPFSPRGFTKNSYMEEMYKTTTDISHAGSVCIITEMGIQGVEAAAMIKDRFPEKKVTLCYTADSVPYLPKLTKAYANARANSKIKSEDLDSSVKLFEQAARKQLLEMGVDLKSNVTIEMRKKDSQSTVNDDNDNDYHQEDVEEDEEYEEGSPSSPHLQKPTAIYDAEGNRIDADMYLWCTKKLPNVSALRKSKLSHCVSPITSEIIVNEEARVSPYKTIFSLGECSTLDRVIERHSVYNIWPASITLSGKVICGRLVATNIIKSILGFPLLTVSDFDRLVEPADLENGMVYVSQNEQGEDINLLNRFIIALGSKRCVSLEISVGEVRVNDEEDLKTINDFKTGLLSRLLGIDFDLLHENDDNNDAAADDDSKYDETDELAREMEKL
ncbi:unnamed protein product [Kuraishia capsulata CBS 1993]|uniref:FAD/NAD(P)-binding domain-containing protein n=1 Tax=Kuraishia capsulata CBS 1993 TaxID=1382522 RepID=W6MI37_9ASCO|nr:uncharacterized protein KUCA_T00001746001 [Kuraishia capsulata CBS 1993]CDK25776.1 unnamed protein product [Kuraishia capsulata CBS 1993]